MADFLKASDLPRLAREVARMFDRRNKGAQECWTLLKAQTTRDFRAVLMKHHPMLCRSIGLVQQLEDTARCVHLYAARSWVRQPDEHEAWQAERFAHPSLMCSTTQRAITKYLPALLPALADLRGIRLMAMGHAHAHHSNSAAAAQLCCAVLTTLTQLEGLHMCVPTSHPDPIPLVAQLAALQVLWLDLGAAPMHRYTHDVPQVLITLTRLRCLHITSTHLLAVSRQALSSNSDKAALLSDVRQSVRLAAPLQHLTQLTLLALCGMRVDACECRELAEQLPKLAELKVLRLTSLHSVLWPHYGQVIQRDSPSALDEQDLVHEGWDALATGLATCTQLTSLDVQGCVPFRDDVIEYFSDQYLEEVIRNLRQLQHLDASGMDVPAYFDIELNWVLSAIIGLTQLTCLSMGYYLFEDLEFSTSHGQLLGELKQLQVLPCTAAGWTACM